ncbi:uncharacterized protein isoform X2 [Musca autumnalis]
MIKCAFPEHKDANEILDYLESFKYKDYRRCYASIITIFQNTPTLHQNSTSFNIKWMGINSNLCMDLIRLSKSKEICSTVENILLLTSLLENALSNVYFTETNGKQAPHLLRDLICTEEIRKVYGTEIVALLKLLMGSPNSINIRNVVWHGFPKPYEIPIYYEAVLLTLVHTMGYKIEEMNYLIKERPLVMDFEKPLHPFDDKFKIKLTNIKFYEDKIQNIDNEFAKDYIGYWLKLCTYYNEGLYINFIILVLPQIELLLRMHYGHINNVDISAKLDEYYITMDTIFETYIANKTSHTESDSQLNQLLDFNIYPQFEGSFHIMYDIFLSPNGCRLRDKVSHGEVELSALNNAQLASVVLHIFLNLLEPLNCCTLVEYESKLHLNCINRHLLEDIHKKLCQFKNNIMENKEDLSLQVIFKPIDKKTLIFRRPHKESELMLLIKTILENVKKTLVNYEQAIAIRSTQLAQRELHSKRRKTLEKLQNSLPQIFATLVKVFESLNILFNLLQSHHQTILEETETFSKTLRYLKHARTVTENFVKYSHYDSNEWIKSLELCCKFQEFHNKLFLYKND